MVVFDPARVHFPGKVPVGLGIRFPGFFRQGVCFDDRLKVDQGVFSFDANGGYIKGNRMAAITWQHSMAEAQDWARLHDQAILLDFFNPE